MRKIMTIIWAIRFKRAKRKADKMAEDFGVRYLVIMLNGKLKVVPKQTIKKLVHEDRFKRGVTIQDILARALYVTK